MLRPLVPDPSFVLSTFAFEAALSPKAWVFVHVTTADPRRAVKVAKSVLSDDRDNLALWDGYARLERQRGNLAAARQVYVTAIQAAQQRATVAGANQADLQLDTVELWAAWAEMEWENGEEERCVEVLGMAAGQNLGQLGEWRQVMPADPQTSPQARLIPQSHYLLSPRSRPDR